MKSLLATLKEKLNLTDEQHKAAAEVFKNTDYRDIRAGGFISNDRYEAEKKEWSDKLNAEASRAADFELALKDAEGKSKSDFESQIKELTAKHESEKAAIAESAIKEKTKLLVGQELAKANCLDVPSAIFKLGDEVMSKITIKDNGDLLGLSEHVAELQKNNAHLFRAFAAEPTATPGDGTGQPKTASGFEQIRQDRMTMTEAEFDRKYNL